MTQPILTIPLQTNPPSHQQNIHYRKDRYGRCRSFKSSFLAAWQHEIQLLLLQELKKIKFQRIAVPYGFSLTIVCKNKKRGDIDNMTKSILDCLEGILFTNDKNCEEAHLYIKYDKNNPRLEISVYPLTQITQNI